MTTQIVISSATGLESLEARVLGNGNKQQAVDVIPGRWVGLSPAERLVVGSGAVVSLSPPAGATHAILYVKDNPIHWYDTGDTPTAGTLGNGPTLVAGDYYEIDLANFALWKMIAVATSAIVDVLYRKNGS